MKLLVAVGLLLVALQVFAEETDSTSEDAPAVAKRGFPAYYHVGCFRDRRRRAIAFIGRVFGRGRVRKCAAIAKRRGFRVFAVQYATHCFAGPRGHIRYGIYGRANNCRHGTGGAWANDVYRFRRLPYVSVGCYKDKHARALPVYLGTRRGNIQWCARQARARGWKIFAVQYYGQCFSGPTAQLTYHRYGVSNGCRNGIGRAWSNYVYRFTTPCSGGKKPARKLRKINRHRVCFGARGNRPGTFRYYGRGKIVNGLVLVYRSGYVTCHYHNIHTRSKWGCGNANLDVLVTDQYNYLIYPQRQYIHHSKGLWYRLPGKHSKHSRSLFFANVASPFHINHGMQLRVWYGEDLKNWTEGDNRGRVCVDVYAWFV